LGKFGVCQAEDEHPLPLMARANLCRRKRVRRHLKTQSFQVFKHLPEEFSSVNRDKPRHVLEKAD
jgi:hypothetical protein